EVVGSEVAGEGVGQAEPRGELGAEQARAEHPQLDTGAEAGRGDDRQLGVAGQQRAQLDDVLREVLGDLVQVLAQRLPEDRRGTGRAAEAEVDPPREEAVERAELLGDHERVVVRQHDPARADADRRGRVADVREHDRDRAAGDTGGGVVLGDPEALVAGLLGGRGELAGLAQGLGDAAALAHRDEVEDRERDHGTGASSAASSAAWARYERALAASSLSGASSMTERQLASAASTRPASIAITPAPSPISG